MTYGARKEAAESLRHWHQNIEIQKGRKIRATNE